MVLLPARASPLADPATCSGGGRRLPQRCRSGRQWRLTLEGGSCGLSLYKWLEALLLSRVLTLQELNQNASVNLNYFTNLIKGTNGKGNGIGNAKGRRKRKRNGRGSIKGNTNQNGNLNSNTNANANDLYSWANGNLRANTNLNANHSHWGSGWGSGYALYIRISPKHYLKYFSEVPDLHSDPHKINIS